MFLLILKVKYLIFKLTQLRLKAAKYDHQASGNIVIHLILRIPRNDWYKLFMDNWYIGVTLASTLIQQGVAVVGPVHSNRLKTCALSNDKVMRQKDRGSSEVKTCEIDGIELCAVR